MMATENRQEIWKAIIERVRTQFGKQPDMNAILFIIGMREYGLLHEKPFKKDDKVSLMHIATCKILSYSGHYELEGIDEEGWPQWQLVTPLPHMTLLEQETYIREHIIDYFINEHIL
ncbi:MAG: hypothetical protein RLZZ60_1105 [Bacteroidota bacterium]|jgi:hypothetical protein